MVIGERLRQLREEKKLSQGDIEIATGLLRCYISRVENGHTVPAIETLEKLARAMGVHLYELFVEGDAPKGLKSIAGDRHKRDKDARFVEQLVRHTSKLEQRDRRLLLKIAAVISRAA